MTWTKLSDDWCESVVLEPLSLAARWHYLCMIQFCSRTECYDGEVRAADARRASDVDDPVSATAELLRGGLLAEREGVYVIVRINEHVPPPAQRDPARKAASAQRKRRSRLHTKGDHSDCLPDCTSAALGQKVLVTAGVTRDPGTGQDGTLATQPQTKKSAETKDLQGEWPPLEACRVCNGPIDPVLAAEGSTHPACDPAGGAAPRKPSLPS